MIGYKLDFNEELYLVPSVLLKKISTVGLSLDLNAKLVIQRKYWVGGNSRYDDSFSAFAGMLVANRLELSYSYDAITSFLSKHTSGSHEILIGYRVNKDAKLVCPSEFW